LMLLRVLLHTLLLTALVVTQSDPGLIPFNRIKPRTNICQVDTQTFRNWRDFTGETTPSAPSYDDGAGIRQSLQVLTLGGESYTTYKATIYAATTADHRAYATLQYATTTSGVFATPVYLDFYFLMQGLTIPQGGYAIIAMFSPDGGTPLRYITLDLDSNNMLHLNFVPNQQGSTQWIYQNFNNPMPSNAWVNITAYIDFSASGGIMAIWQDGVIQSVANVNGGSGTLKQMHLGLIASGAISSGTIYNYNLVTQKVCTSTPATTTSTAVPSPGTTSSVPTTTSTTSSHAPVPTTTQRAPTIPIPTPDTTTTSSPDTGRNSATKVMVSLPLLAVLVYMVL